jgi:hypothetical protein
LCLLALFVLGLCQDDSGSVEIKEDCSQIKGYIGPKQITTCELERISKSLRDIIALNRGQETADLDPSQLEREAWLHLALLIEAQQRGIRVTEQEVDEFIHNNRRFQVNYRFDPSRYQLVLSSLQIGPDQFRQTVEDWLMIDKLFNSIRDEVVVGEEELRKAFWEAYELRKANYVIFPLNQYLNPEDISAAAQGASSPEFKDKIRQAEEKSLAQAEKYHGLIQELMQKEGIPFQRAVSKLGLKIRETGYFSRNVPPADIEQPDWMWNEAFLISEAELSSVVPVREGYLFFTINEIFPPTEQQYSRARNNFFSSYKRIKGDKRVEEYKRSLRSKIRILEPSSAN